MMTTMLSRNETAAWLGAHDHFAIVTHRRPDGDTAGSAAALCRMLRALGKTAHILTNPELTEKYAFLHKGLTKDKAAPGDTLVAVDVAAPNMLPNVFHDLTEKIALRIDHHESASSFTPLELVDGAAAACGEIIYDILMILGLSLSKAMAEALYTAVSTDTGCFRYANTDAHSFTVAAACYAAGGDLPEINRVMFETNSLAKLRLQGWMVENARLLAGGQIVLCPIPMHLITEFGLQEEDLENISSFPRTIAGVKIAATLRENKEDSVRLSVRAVPGYDAAAVCTQFGGGGHKGAAGATIRLPLEQAIAAAAAAMPEMEP